MEIESIVDVIYQCVDEVNLQQAEDNQIAKELETALFGEDSGIDSLALINLIMGLEQRIFDATGIEVILMGSDEVTADNGPLQSVAHMAAFVKEELSK